MFALGSITAALAPTPEVLLGGRAFQGLGAAVTTPTAVSIITNIFPPGSKRNRALAIYAAVGAAGSSFGLVLGGIITSFLNWQWIFFINAPIAAVVLLLAPRYVPPSRDSEEVTFDVLGAVTLTGGLLAGVYAITEVIHYGWSDPRILGTTAASAILLGSFVVHERRVSDPLVPFDVFHPRSMKIAIVATVALAGGVVSLLFFGTQYFQSIHQYTALRTGLAFLPMGLTSLLISIYLSGQLLSQYGLGPILAGGMGLAAVGFGYLSMVPIDGSYWVAFLPGLTVMAAGYGLAMPCVTVGAVADIDEARHGLATGIQQTAGQVGAGAGFALYVMIAATLTVFGSGDGVSGAKALGGGFKAAMATAAVVAGAAALAALTLRSGIGVDSTASEPATDRQVPMPEPSD